MAHFVSIYLLAGCLISFFFSGSSCCLWEHIFELGVFFSSSSFQYRRAAMCEDNENCEFVHWLIGSRAHWGRATEMLCLHSPSYFSVLYYLFFSFFFFWLLFRHSGTNTLAVCCWTLSSTLTEMVIRMRVILFFCFLGIFKWRLWVFFFVYKKTQILKKRNREGDFGRFCCCWIICLFWEYLQQRQGWIDKICLCGAINKQ